MPPVLLLLTSHPIVDRYDLSSLRMLGVSATPVSPEMTTACKQRFARRVWSVNIGQSYALTEICACFFPVPPRLVGIDNKLYAAGGATTQVPIEGMARRDVPIGTPGELWIRSPAIMKRVTRATDRLRSAC